MNTDRRRFLTKASGTAVAIAAANLAGAPNVIAQPKIKWRMSTSWTAANDILRDDLREKEIKKIVGAASLGASAGHTESAKRMACDNRPSDLAVDVKIADAKFGFHPSDTMRTSGEETAGKGIGRAVGNAKRLIEVVGIDNRKNRSKNFLLS